MSSHLLPPPLDVFYPVTAHRNFVSASRLYNALRHQLKCVPTGDRGAAGEYWITPRGVRFPVRDAMTRDSSPIVSVADRRSLCYPYDYAYAVLAHASWLVAHAVPEDMLQAAADASDSPAHRQPPHDLSDLAFV